MKFLLSCLLSVLSLTALAQPGKTPSSKEGNVNETKRQVGSLAVDSALGIPKKDTTFHPYRAGFITMRPQDGILYMWDSTTAGKKWVRYAKLTEVYSIVHDSVSIKITLPSGIVLSLDTTTYKLLVMNSSGVSRKMNWPTLTQLGYNVPTFQQALTSGSTLTTNNLVYHPHFDYIQQGKYFRFDFANGNISPTRIFADSTHAQLTVGVRGISITDTAINLTTVNGNYFIDSLNKSSDSRDSVMLWNPITKKVSHKAITSISGIASLNGLTGPTQTFGKVDDTNVGMTIGSTGTTHTWTLSWIGTLADSRIASASVWNAKQAALVSGTNIKTVGGVSILGSGNIAIANQKFGDVSGDFTASGSNRTFIHAFADLTFQGVGGLGGDLKAMFFRSKSSDTTIGMYMHKYLGDTLSYVMLKGQDTSVRVFSKSGKVFFPLTLPVGSSSTDSILVRRNDGKLMVIPKPVTGVTDTALIKRLITDSLNSINSAMVNGDPSDPTKDSLLAKPIDPGNDSDHVVKAVAYGWGVMRAASLINDSTWAFMVDTSKVATISRVQSDSVALKGFLDLKATQSALEDSAAAIRADMTGGVGAITPWPSDIDGAQHNLLNTKSIDVNIKSSGGTPSYTAFNPSDKSISVGLSGSNLVATQNGNSGSVRSVLGVSSGKWYWEYKLTGFDNVNATFGVATSAMDLSEYVGRLDAFGKSLWGSGCDKLTNNTFTSYGTGNVALNDIIQVKLDMDAGTIEFGKNNTFFGTAFTGLTGTYYAAVGNFSNTNVITANFGATSFTYSVPSGYNAGLYSLTGGPADTLNVLVTDSVTGNVGIGKLPTNYKLDIGGQVHIDTLNNGTPNVDSIVVVNNGVLKKVVNNITPIVRASADLTAQTATTNIVSYTTGASDGTYLVSAYADVTAVSAGVLTITVTYTDTHSNSRTATFYGMGTTTAGLSVTGSSNFAVLGELRVKASTAITAVATLTVGTATFDASATITQIR